MDDVDRKKFLDRMKTVKAAVVEDEGARAESHTIDVPYNAREALLDRLRKDLYDDYMALENMSKTDRDKITFDELVSSCGKIAGAMMDVIAFSESSPFRDQLRQIMNFWGEWVYLMDAVDDYDEDMKNGGFNPLFLAGSPCNIEKRIIDIEEKANAVLDVLAVLNNYELVDFLFRKSFCETREELFKKCRANRIEV